MNGLSTSTALMLTSYRAGILAVPNLHIRILNLGPCLWPWSRYIIEPHVLGAWVCFGMSSPITELDWLGLGRLWNTERTFLLDETSILVKAASLKHSLTVNQPVSGEESTSTHIVSIGTHRHQTGWCGSNIGDMGRKQHIEQRRSPSCLWLCAWLRDHHLLPQPLAKDCIHERAYVHWA